MDGSIELPERCSNQPLQNTIHPSVSRCAPDSSPDRGAFVEQRCAARLPFICRSTRCPRSAAAASTPPRISGKSCFASQTSLSSKLVQLKAQRFRANSRFVCQAARNPGCVAASTPPPSDAGPSQPVPQTALPRVSDRRSFVSRTCLRSKLLAFVQVPVYSRQAECQREFAKDRTIFPQTPFCFPHSESQQREPQQRSEESEQHQPAEHAKDHAQRIPARLRPTILLRK